MALAIVRGPLTVLGCAGASAALLRLAWLPGLRWAGLPAAIAQREPDESLPLVLALGLCLFTGWLSLTMAATAAAGLPGATGQLARAALSRVAPPAMRRLAEVLIGATTVIATSAAVAHAGEPAQRPSLDRPVAAQSQPETVQLTLDRPVSERPRAQQLRQVTVREGDSLWRIAAAALPKGSSEPAIEAAWHRWYQTNRAVIGADPGLLQPGQVLAPPAD